MLNGFGVYSGRYLSVRGATGCALGQDGNLDKEEAESQVKKRRISKKGTWQLHKNRNKRTATENETRTSSIVSTPAYGCRFVYQQSMSDLP